MRTPSGDVLLSPRDAAYIKRVLSQGIRMQDSVNGGVPTEIVRIYGEICEAAQRFRARGSGVKASSDTVRGTEQVPQQGNSAGSAATDDHWLSVAEAATLAGWSESYTRRQCRQGNVVARRSVRGGAWHIDRGSLMARLDSPDTGDGAQWPISARDQREPST